MRRLHIDLSMFGLAVVLFFSVTGLMLDQPDWFGESPRSTGRRGFVADFTPLRDLHGRI